MIIAIIAMTGLLAPAYLPAAPAATASKAVLVPCSQGANTITVTTDTTLSPACTYTGHFEITASNLTFNCQGATIDGAGQAGVGIEVSAQTSADLSNVTIRDCVAKDLQTRCE